MRIAYMVGVPCLAVEPLRPFFFQAEDGIRDLYVTGVQTCALPISIRRRRPRLPPRSQADRPLSHSSQNTPRRLTPQLRLPRPTPPLPPVKPSPKANQRRSEERRVGKECSRSCSAYQVQKDPTGQHW